METPGLWKYILIFTVVVLLLVRYKDYIRTCKLALFLRGPPIIPIIGNNLVFKSDGGCRTIANGAEIYKANVIRIWVSVIPFICFMEPRHLQIILTSGKATDKNLLYSAMQNFLGKGLLTINGHKWKSHRKLIQPYFHINVLTQFIDVFHKGANLLVDNLKNKGDVNIAPIVNDCIFHILQEGILGVPMEDFDYNSPYKTGVVYLYERMRKPWLLIESLFKFSSAGDSEFKQNSDLYTYTKEILYKRMMERKNGATPKISLMDFFIEIFEENPDFTTDDIISEISTFMLAGQESVATTASFALYFLAKHQDVQEKVVEEQRSIMIDNNHRDELTLADLNKMVYLEQCINETLRLIPVAAIFSRVLSEDVKVDNYIVPKGTNVFVSPLSTHRLTHIYPDPDRFDPERFSPENMKKLHPFAFIPFSGGPRNCIGYKYAYIELKTILSNVLRNYQFSLIPGKEDVEIYIRITLRAKGGVPLNVKPRKLFTT